MTTTLILLILCLTIVGLSLRYGGKMIRERDKYHAQYEIIKDIIHDNPATIDRMVFIRSLFVELGKLQYKNKEYTQVLFMEFCRKYERLLTNEANFEYLKATSAQFHLVLSAVLLCLLLSSCIMMKPRPQYSSESIVERFYQADTIRHNKTMK